MPRALLEPFPWLAAVEPAGSCDRVAMLAVVDFKWLMAGQGAWIDTQRLRADPSYRASLVAQALTSRCSALRECAALLQTLAANPTQHA